MTLPALSSQSGAYQGLVMDDFMGVAIRARLVRQKRKRHELVVVATLVKEARGQTTLTARTLRERVVRDGIFQRYLASCRAEHEYNLARERERGGLV